MAECREPQEVVSAQDATLMRRACFTGSVESLQELLAEEPEKKVLRRMGAGSLPLNQACFHGLPEIVKILLNYVPEKQVLQPDGSEKLPLHSACIRPSPAIAAMLLKYSPEQQVLQKDSWGRLPLHWVCYRPSADLVHQLLEHNPEPQTLHQDAKGNIPLHIAIEGFSLEHVRVVKALLNHEPEVQLRLVGRTALMSALNRELWFDAFVDFFAQGILMEEYLSLVADEAMEQRIGAKVMMLRKAKSARSVQTL